MTRTHHLGACLLGLLAGVLGSSSNVMAQAAGQEDHYARGILLLDQGCTAEALREYELAYQQKSYPRLLYRIGVLHQELGRPLEAMDALRRFLAVDRNIDAETRGDVARRMRELQHQLSQPAPDKPTPRSTCPVGAASSVISTRPGDADSSGSPPPPAVAAPSRTRARAVLLLPRHRISAAVLPFFLAVSSSSKTGHLGGGLAEVAYRYRHRSGLDMGVKAALQVADWYIEEMSYPRPRHDRVALATGTVVGHIGYAGRWGAFGLSLGSGYPGYGADNWDDRAYVLLFFGFLSRIGRLDATHFTFEALAHVYPVPPFVLVDMQLNIPLRGRFWLGIDGRCGPGDCVSFSPVHGGFNLQVHFPGRDGAARHIVRAGAYVAAIATFGERGFRAVGPMLLLGYERRIY